MCVCGGGGGWRGEDGKGVGGKLGLRGSGHPASNMEYNTVCNG